MKQLMKPDNMPHKNQSAGPMKLMLTVPLALLLGACSVGPDYVRPEAAAVPVAFKEMQDWKPAQPSELVQNGKWWEMFGDPQLNALVEQIDVSNQNLAQYEAKFRQALALVQGHVPIIRRR